MASVSVLSCFGNLNDSDVVIYRMCLAVNKIKFFEKGSIELYFLCILLFTV